TLASPYACAPRTTATPRPALPAALPLRPRDAIFGRGPRADRVGRGHRQPPARGVGVLSPTVRAWLPFVAAALACGGALGLGFATGVLDLGARAPLALLVVLPWAWHVHLRGRAG